MIRADVARAIACATACAVAVAQGCACESTIGLNGGDGSDTAGDPLFDPGVYTDGADWSGEYSYDPPREPDWDLFEDGTGETGWEDSVGTFPDDRLQKSNIDIWSDHRGVFVLQMGHTTPDVPDLRELLYMNDGTGWTVLLDWAPEEIDSVGAITGVEWGWLFLNGERNVASFHDGGLEFLETGARLSQIAAVRDDLAYATLESEPWLAWWDGATWSPYPGPALPYPIHRVWADEESIFCAGDNGIVLSLEAGEWVLHSTGTLESIWMIRGSAASDLWAGTDSGRILHYDGAGWSATEWPGLGLRGEGCNDGQIREIWAAEGEAFFATDHEILHWDGASFETLAYWPSVETIYSIGGPPTCDYGTFIDAMWGTTPDEVFVAISQEYVDAYRTLGDHRILWWDGSEFHWM